MIAYLCDGPGCNQRIDVRKPGWLGVDEKREDSVTDDDDEFDFGDEYGLHFCGPECLAAWAMSRQLSEL